MKIGTILCGTTLLLTAATVEAADVGLNLNLNVGSRRPVYSLPAIPAPSFMLPTPPVFLTPPGLGLSVAIDIPYDMVHIDGFYYVYHGDVWHRGRHYNGPWTQVRPDLLPYGLRKHKHRDIIIHRDREYHRYREHEHRGDYRGRIHHPVDHRDRRDWDRHDRKDWDRRDRDHDRGKDRGHDRDWRHDRD
ncbi:hypothetical protein [Trichloromonas sp.]|uniref:hypothetical protein n=1 Tax=Trichloromonas sp. TaxID=3069249 RepID=UPI002A39C51D|nr:hypothetical protein [Trichloromonas sp.]